MMRRILGVAVVGALLLALPACGNKTDEHARAAGITPASAFAFLSVSLDPSIEQKRNLLSIVRRFPEAEVKDDFDESRDELLSSILDAAGLDYEQGVKPWLGSELAVAVLPGNNGSQPLVAVLIEQDDSDAAKAAIDKANARAQEEGGAPIAYRLVGDFVVATDGSDQALAVRTLEAFANQADDEDDSLSRSKEFTDVVDELHGDRLLLGWVDGKDAIEQLAAFLEDADIPVDALLDEAAPVAFDIHAARSAIVMEAVAPVTDESSGGKPELTEGLPQDSYGAITVFDLRQIAREGLQAALGGEGRDVMAEFARETGLDLEADLLSWMGGEAVLVAAPGEEFPNLGLIVEPTDRAAAEAALPKIRDALARAADEAEVDLQPAVELFEDRFVLASSAEYLEALSKGASPSFGEGDAYRSVLGELSSDETRVQFVVDIDAIRETFEGFMDEEDRAEYERDTLPNIEPLDAVGMVVSREGGFDRAELKLTFD